jgi:hypothetical protein
VAYYKSLGVTVTRAMTDNGSCYQSFAFRDACRNFGIKHIGKALHAQNKRQGRALHSDSASGMGLCPGLPNIRSSGPRPAATTGTDSMVV